MQLPEFARSHATFKAARHLVARAIPHGHIGEAQSRVRDFRLCADAHVVGIAVIDSISKRDLQLEAVRVDKLVPHFRRVGVLVARPVGVAARRK